MSEGITYSQLFDLLRDPETTDDALKEYFTVVPGTGGLDFQLEINPDKVIMTEADLEMESAMGIGNGAFRLMRVRRYNRGRRKHPERPVLLSEGDSWFQFPLLIKETIDHLSNHYNIWSLGAAGDTLANMIGHENGGSGFEFIQELRRIGPDVSAFLFSAAGNDILGEDPKDGLPMLQSLLRPFNGNPADIEGHIDAHALDARMASLEAGYLKMIALIRAEPGCEALPIVIHGYDYAFPYPASDKDPRKPIHAKKDQWLGRAFAAQGINDPHLRHEIIKRLVDRLYSMMDGLETKAKTKGIWVVNCRGALPKVTDWADEIHGTSDGFAKVAGRFHKVIESALAQRAALS